jgi:ketosteroid isomerase-like protein
MTPAGYATPEQAEQAFYDAFQRADLTAMMEVWADREFIECIHPMSARIRGYSAVEASWRSIFSSGIRMRISCSDIQRTRDSLLAIHVLHEHLDLPGRNTPLPPIIATNIYQLVDDSWRMVLHHASPSPGSDAATSENTAEKPHRGRPLH